MPTPTAVFDTTLVKPSPLVEAVYGEPRFHTEGDIAAVAFGPDGTIFAVDEAGVLRHWSTDGKLLGRHYLSDLETLWAFSPTADRVASGTDDLLLWDTATGSLLHRFGKAAWVTAIAFSQDGHLLASGHDDGRVRVWDAASFQLMIEYTAHTQPVSALAFTTDGQHLATAAEDRTVRVWDRTTGKNLADLYSHTDRIPALSWTAGDTLLISAGWDTSARVWQMGRPDPVMLLNSHSDQVLTLTGRGGQLATADSDNDIHLWADPATATVHKVLSGHVDEIRCLAFNTDGTRLASGGADRVVHIWDVATGQLLAGPNPTGKHHIAVRPLSTGGLALVSTAAPKVRAWNVDTGAELSPTGTTAAYCVAASPDGRWLAVGGTDHLTRLHDAQAPAAMRTLEATKPPIGGLAFSKDGTKLLQTSPADGLVWVWNTATGNPDLILIEAADGCTLESVAVHPDGNHVIVGGIDYLSTDDRTGAVCVWDLTSKLKAHVFDVGVYAVAVDPSGRYVAGAGINDMVYVWDMTTGDQVFELAGHQEKIHCVAFSPDGSYLLSGGDDMTVRVWDVLSGRLIVAREFDSAVQGLAFSTDGRSVFTGNGNTTCYRIEFRKLIDD